MIALIYIPLLIIIQFFAMYIAYRTNEDPRWFYTGCAFAIACCWVWPLVTIYSKNIVFDAVLFDITICVSCAVFGVYLASHTIQFTRIEIIGIIIAVVGLLIFKVGAIVK